MTLWTYIGQIVNFIIFVVILYYLLYRPVRNILKQRRDRMEKDLRDAEKKRREAEELRNEAEDKAREVEETRDSIIQKAREEAGRQRDEILEQAEQQSQDRLQRFRRIMEQEQREVLQKVYDDLRNTVVRVSQTVLADASDSLSGRALQRLDKILGEMPEEDRNNARQFLNTGDNRAVIRSASPLDDEKKQQVSEVIARHTGVENPPIDFQEDSSLIAGIHVSFGHVNIEAHWRDVIDQALKKQLSGTQTENPTG